MSQIAANRHERRRQAAIGEMRTMPTDQITGCHCGWKGCDASFEGFALPGGWSDLIVHNTAEDEIVSVQGKPMLNLEGLAWRHDKTLCPTHTRALDELLLPGTGGADPLSEVSGNA
jgi:hypothetical protein